MAVTGAFGSSHREAPGILKDPTADNTDVYAFTAPDAPGAVTVVANWVPLRGAGRRPVLRQARSRRALLRQDRQHRRRLRGRRLSLGLPPALPQPELVPVRGAAGDVDRRSGPQLRPDVRPLPRHVQEPPGDAVKRMILRNAPVAPDNVGPKTMPNYETVSMGAVKSPLGRRQDVRRPGRRPVLRRPRRRLRRDQHRQARPAEHRPRQPGRRQRRRVRLQHALVRAAGPQGRGHPATAAPSRARTPPTP